MALMRSEAIAAVVAAADHFCITAEKLSNIFSSICVVMIFDGTTDLLEVFNDAQEFLKESEPVKPEGGRRSSPRGGRQAGKLFQLSNSLHTQGVSVRAAGQFGLLFNISDIKEEPSYGRRIYPERFGNAEGFEHPNCNPY